MPVLYAGECGGLCTGAGGTESAAYRRRDAEDCARRGWAWHHALPDYRRGTAGKKRVRGAGAENKKAVPGTASVGITTNGVRLASCARDLRAAGCDSVNVSLDTVDAAEFAALTGRDALEQVKQGICAAKEAGLLVKAECGASKRTACAGTD